MVTWCFPNERTDMVLAHRYEEEEKKEKIMIMETMMVEAVIIHNDDNHGNNENGANDDWNGKENSREKFPLSPLQLSLAPPPTTHPSALQWKPNSREPMKTRISPEHNLVPQTM